MTKPVQPEVRSQTGVPAATAFGSNTGTPLVVNTTTGDGYVLTAAGTVAGIGSGHLITARAINGVNFDGSASIAVPTLHEKVINGWFPVDQRNSGVSQTITAAAALAYTVDRFYAYCTGANVTGQRVAGATQSEYAYQFTGAASVTAIGFGTRLTSVSTYDLNGTTATLSVDLANSLLTTVTWTAYYANSTDAFGTLGAPTVTQIATGTFTVTSTVTNYQTQITIPAAATTGIQVVLTVGAQISGTWTIRNLSLKQSSVNTNFDRRPYDLEFALCRAFRKTVRCAASDNGAAANTKLYYVPINFADMRAAPTVSYTAITSTNVTSRTAQQITPFGFTHVVQASGGPSMFEESNAVLDCEL